MTPITRQEYDSLPNKALYAIAKPDPFSQGHYYFCSDGNLAALPDIKPGRTLSKNDAFLAAMNDPESDGVAIACGDTWQFIPLKETDKQGIINPMNTALFAPYRPFEDALIPSMPFPIEVFPEPFRAYDEAASQSFQVDVVMPGMGTLCTLSAIFSRCGFHVRVYDEWLEWLGLNGMMIAPPSGMKSPTISDIKRPMDEAVIRHNKEIAEKISYQRTLLDAKKKKLEAVKAGYAKGNSKYGESELRKAQSELSQAENNLEHEISFFVDDITSEELGILLQDNNEFIAMFNGEGGNFADLLAGAYRGGSTKGAMDIVLKAYSGESHSVHRVGRKEVVLSHPKMTILLGVQPGLFKDIMANTDNVGRGICARFLYAFPESRTGKRTLIGVPIPKETREAYTERIDRLMRFALEWKHEDTTLTLSKEAFEILEELHNRIEPQIEDMSDTLQEWIGKFRGVVVRIAGLLYLAKTDGKIGEIDAESMRGAVQIGEYFRAQAEYAFSEQSEPQSVKDARYILKKLLSDNFCEHRENGEVTRKELFDRVKCSRFRTVEAMHEGLQELEDRGYIFQKETKTGEKGRPSQLILLNPEAFDLSAPG